MKLEYTLKITVDLNEDEDRRHVAYFLEEVGFTKQELADSFKNHINVELDVQQFIEEPHAVVKTSAALIEDSEDE